MSDDEHSLDGLEIQEGSHNLHLGQAWATVYANASRPQRSWLRNSQLVNLDQSIATIAVPNDFTQNLLHRMHDLIEQVLSDCFEQDIRLDYILDPELSLAEGGFDAEPTDDVAPADSDYRPLHEAAAPPVLVKDLDTDCRLNPKYSFETFVIGSSNRFAHAAAVAVAEAPGKSYNPLMIYGQSGLGKTHLLHALGHYVRSYYDRVQVRYVTTEELTNDFINAISQNRIVDFRARYRHVDVLLIDDIQFLETRDRTQEEFFHTFNTLHNAQKQIVMTSDRPPKLLESLTPRLRSRFEMGLITDIQPPDLETRIAILRKKAAHERLAINADVLEFIGSRIQTNIRELEGALIRVTAFASLNRQPADMTMAEIVLRDLIPDDPVTEITPKFIISETARYFDVSADDLCGPSRASVIARPRQIAMYLCRELTDLSLPKIAKEFNKKDHSTILYAVNKVGAQLSEDRNLYNQVAELTSRIKQQAAIR